MLNEALNKEFEALMARMADYYDVKKQILETKKNNLALKYEQSLLKLRYQQMKQELAMQRKSWNSLVAQYA